MYDLMDRNVRRIIKQFPELDTTEPSERLVYEIIDCFLVLRIFSPTTNSIDATRVSKSFSAFNITGLRFTIFHLIFNRYNKMAVFLN